MPKAQIKAAIAAQLHSVNDCYQHELDVRPPFSGALMLRFIIQPDGSASDLIILQSNGLSPRMEDCVLAAVPRWRFPRPVGGGVDVHYPFTFSPNEGQ